MSNITVYLKDGSEREIPAGSSALVLAESISRRLAKDAVAAKVNNIVVDLTRELEAGATVEDRKSVV